MRHARSRHTSGALCSRAPRPCTDWSTAEMPIFRLLPGFLTVCLLSAVMVLVSATTTPIARPSANVSGHQYRTVMRAYMRGYAGCGVFKIILITVFSAVLGVVFFFESIKTM